jgi:hypothetical protein
MPAFPAFDLVSRLPNWQSQSSNRRKSPVTPRIFPLCGLSAETGFDHDCCLRTAVEFISFFGSSSAFLIGHPMAGYPDEARNVFNDWKQEKLMADRDQVFDESKKTQL